MASASRLEPVKNISSAQVSPELVHPFEYEVKALFELLDSDLKPDEIISEWGQALAEMIGDDRITDADQGRILIDSAGAHIRIYERSGVIHYLAMATEMLHRATDLVDEDSSSRPLLESYLGVTHGYVFDANNTRSDLERAVQLTAHSIRSSSEGDWRLPVFALNAGLQVVRLYQFTSQVELLDFAIDLLNEAAKTRPGSPVHQRAVGALSALREERSEVIGDRPASDPSRGQQPYGG